MNVCSIESHEALKLDQAVWLSLAFVGIQFAGDDEPSLEMRNCTCGSTLCKPVAKEPS